MPTSTALEPIPSTSPHASAFGRGHSHDWQALVPQICARLETGEDLTSICESDASFPSYNAIRDLCEKQPEIGSSIARARARGFDHIAMNCRLIARGDKTAGATGDVQRDRLIVDTDLKLLAKWDPKRYGDLLRLGGPNGESLAPPVVNQFIIQPVRAAPAAE